jgi:hypothetical protein
MAQSVIANPGLIEIERPACPKCHGPMTFTGLTLGNDDVEIRAFQCSLCNYTEKVIVKQNQPG